MTLNINDVTRFVMENIPATPASTLAKITRFEDIPTIWRNEVPSPQGNPSLDLNDSEFYELIERIYLEDNYEGLKKVFAAEEKYDPIDRATMFGRNQMWSDEIEREMKEGGAFVAVGLDHLHNSSGNGKSLLQILEERGFKVTSLPKFTNTSHRASSRLKCSEIF